MRDPRHYTYYAKFAQKRVSANKDNSSYTIGPEGTEVYPGVPEILYNDLVFVKDARLQWTHGQLYSFVGASYIWLSKTLIPVRREISAWAENGVDPTATIDTQYVTIEAKVFYEMEEEVIKRIEPRTTPGIHNVSITYSDDHKTAYISFGIDGVDVSANTDVPFVFFSEHLGNSGRTTIVTIVPTADGKDGDRGDVGVGIGLVNEEYLANDGTTPSKADSGFTTSALAGFGPDKPFLWRRLSIYSTESLLINDPEWNFVGHFAVNGRDIQAEYSEDGIHWSSYHEGCVYMRIMKADGTWSDPFLIVGEDGLDGPHTDFSFGISQHANAVEPNNALSGPSDIADSDWTDGPQAVTKEKPYLWMRSLRWELDHTTRKLVYEKYTNGTPKYYYTRLTGEAGVSPLIVDLSNEMTSVPVDLNNVVVGEKTIQLELHAFIGTKEQDITRVEMVAKPGFTLRTTSNVNKPQLIIADGTELADTTDIELRAYIGTEYRTAIFSVAAVKSHNGKDAEIYELAPRKSSLSFARDENNALTPAQLKEEVRIKYVKGETTAVFGVNDPQVSHLKAKYGFTDDESTHTDYNPSTQIAVTAQDVTDNGYDTLYLSLWDGTKLIDRESIPILKDGAKGKDGDNGVSPVVVDLENEMTSVPVGTNGEVTKDGGISLELSIKAFIGITPVMIESVSCADAPAYATFHPNVDAPTANARPTITFSKGAILDEVTDFAISVLLATNETRIVTFTVAAVRSVNGKDAVLFELAPRKSSLSFARDDNNALTPSQLKEEIRIKRIEGESNAVFGVNDPKVSHLTAKFGFSDDESTHKAYNPTTQIVVTAQDATDYDTLYLSLWNGSTLIDRESIPILKDGNNGKDGESPVIVDLENEMTSIPVGQDGSVSQAIYLGLKLHAFVGTQTVGITNATCELNADLADKFAFSADTKSEPIITVKAGKVPAEITEFPIVVTVEGGYQRTVTYTVAAVKSGGKGEDAVLRELFVSPNSVAFIRDANGNLTPNSQEIAVLIKQTTGSKTETIPIPDGTDGITVRWAWDTAPASSTSGTQLVAETNGNKANVISVSKSDAASHRAVGISAFVGTKLIDKETIPIVKDGEDGAPGTPGKDGKDAVTLDIDNEMDSIPCDVNGNTTKLNKISTNVRLYVGATPKTTLTADDVRATEIGNVTSAITPTITNVGSNTGVVNVEWSIPAGTSLDGRYTSTITCEYGGVTYEAIFTLVAVRAGLDGKSPTIYNVRPSISAIAFACEDGENYTPASISVTCGYTKQVGDGAVDSFDTVTAPIDGKYYIYYRTSTNGNNTSWTQYTGAITVASNTTASRYDFCIAEGTHTTVTKVIDIEGVPVTRDGKRGAKGEDGKDGAGAVQPNLFGVDSIVKDSDANTAALHTDTGLYIYRSSSAGTNSCTIIDDISEGTFYVQCNGSAVIGYYSGSSFVSATNKTANGITSANVTISGSQRIAIKVSGSVTLSDIKIEEGAGLTAPTAYCRKRTLNVKAIQDSLFSDTWNANSGVSNATIANSYKQKYTTYVLTSTGVLSQTVNNLVAGKRYCISFYTYGTANVTATITNHRTAYYCNLSSTKYGEMSNNQVTFTAAASSFKLCKIVFVADSTISAISFRGACRLSLLKIEEGEDRTLSRDEVNTRDLSALSNSEIDQVKVSYEASSMSASAGVASATKLEVSTSAMTITSPGVVVLKDTDTNVAINVSSFKDGDVLRLICNSKTITNDDAKRVVVPMGADSGLLKDEVTPIAILNSDPNDTELKDDFSLTGHLHKITLSSAGKFEGIGSLIVNSQDDVASERIALSGSRTIHFAGGILEFVYLAGTMWMRMANAIDFFVDYPSLNETVNYNVDKSSGVPFTAKRIIDRKYFGERIQYIFVKQ